MIDKDEDPPFTHGEATFVRFLLGALVGWHIMEILGKVF